MDADNESQLERRAVEELLKEASRARVRAETMGPAGWMKCPLGSTNKRFLLNTLRSSALERRSGGQTATTRREDERRSEGDKRYRSEEKERSHRKDREHRKEQTGSHSQSERQHTSSRNALASREHSPHHSNRTRSRSPVRDRSALRKSRDRT
ncbi:protein POLR1D-like [Colossoma macropomum]|uniref:protein POLR1D-like n=1 Tax=Colossoma macropomum TaxID=42526 RepID=UPI0018652EBC|nr:protein POLR1D-like [Colossoma macropomum]